MKKEIYINNLIFCAKVIGLSDQEINEHLGSNALENARMHDRDASEAWKRQRSKPALSDEDEALLVETGAENIKEAKLITKINLAQNPYELANLCHGDLTELAQQKIIGRIRDMYGFGADDYKKALGVRGLKAHKYIYESIADKMISVIGTFGDSKRILIFLKQIQHQENADMFKKLELAVIDKMLERAVSDNELFEYFTTAVSLGIEPDKNIVLSVFGNTKDVLLMDYFEKYCNNFEVDESDFALEIIKSSRNFEIINDLTKYVDVSTENYFNDVVMSLLSAVKNETEMYFVWLKAILYFKNLCPEFKADGNHKRLLEHSKVKQFISEAFDKMIKQGVASQRIGSNSDIFEIVDYLDNPEFQKEFPGVPIIKQMIIFAEEQSKIAQVAKHIQFMAKRFVITEGLISGYSEFDSENNELAKAAIINLLEKSKI